MNASHLIDLFERIAEAPDAVGRLRRFVLDLAVRGKLVEQDPADESASELLNRIAEARRLVPTLGRKANNATDQSSLAGTAFSSPAGWESAQLSKLVQILNGRAYKKAELLDSGTPVLRVGNLFTSKHWYYSNLQLEESKYCDEGDLLYAWSASFGPVIWQGPRVIYHYHIWKLLLYSEADLYKRYLYYFLLQHTREIRRAGHGISMIHMTKGNMEKLVVPVPPLAEQRRIVAKVDELMALCDRLEKACTTREDIRGQLTKASLIRLSNSEANEAAFRSSARVAVNAFPTLTTRSDQVEHWRRAILRLAVRGKLVEQDPADEPADQLVKRIAANRARLIKIGKTSWSRAYSPIAPADVPFAIPKSWTWIRLRNIGRLAGGMTPSKNRPEYWDGDIVWLSPKDIKANVVSDSQLKITSKALADTRIELFPPGSVFMVARSGILRRTFPVAINRIPATSNQDLKVLVPFLQGQERYIQIMLRGLTPLILNDLVKTGTTVQSLKYAEFAAQPIPLSPLTEQSRIVAKVDKLMALCDRLEGSIATTDDTRARLLESLLRNVLASAVDGTYKQHSRQMVRERGN